MIKLPPGFATVFPYFVVDDCERYLAFLVAGLGAREIGRHVAEDGRIANAQMDFFGFSVMVGSGANKYPATVGSHYLFVENADVAMERALDAGATLEMPVEDRPYGDRQGGVKDFAGNIWWISQRLVAGPYYP